MKIFPSLVVVSVLSLAPLSAQTVVSWYRGGEADSGPTNNATIVSAVDSGSASIALSNTLGANYTTVTAPSANLRFGTSTFAFGLGGGSYLSANSTSTTATSNFGIEAWVQPSAVGFGTGTQIILSLGTSGTNGYGLAISGGKYQAQVNGTFYDTGVSASVGTWTEFALVNQGGTSTLFINGSAAGSTFSATPTTPSAHIELSDATNYFAGRIDEARVFTFSAGTFTTSELNYVSAVPEPASWTALAGGIMLATVLVKRRLRTRADSA